MAAGIQTLRPNGTVAVGGWSAEPSGTLHGVTSDNSDSTYAQSTVLDTGVMNLDLTSYTLGGERVARSRIRIRGQSNDSIISVDTNVRLLLGVERTTVVTLPPSITNRTSSWWIPNTLVSQNNVNGARFRAVALSSPHTGVPPARLMEVYVDLDIRSVIEIDTMEVRDAAGTDRCNGVITDTQQPYIYAETTYGYANAPGGTSVSVQIERRIYTQAQTAVPGFTPWPSAGGDGGWGPPVWDYSEQGTNNQRGTPTVRGLNTPALENDTYVIFMRIGTRDFLQQTGKPWWSDTTSCEFTINVQTPDAPTIDCVVSNNCPLEVEVEVCHVAPTTGAWVNANEVRMQVQRSNDGGTTWENLYAPTNGNLVDEGTCVTATDRFVYPNTATLYRARLYGEAVALGYVETEWAECSIPATLFCGCIQETHCDESTDVKCAGCTSWLIHPSDEARDWSGTEGPGEWSTIRPYASAQPLVGGHPTISQGRQSGRNHVVTFTLPSASEARELVENTLSAALLWFVPENAGLPPIWVSPGPEVVVSPLQVNGLHQVTVALTETGPEPVVLPEFGGL